MCEIHATSSFLQNVRDRIGSVLTNIYLSDIEYPDRKEKSNKRNPDIATFMAEVSKIVLVVVIYSSAFRWHTQSISHIAFTNISASA